MTSEALKQVLLHKLEQLPEDRLCEVVDFVGFLLSQTETRAAKQPDGLEPDKDPLLDLIGQVEARPFAHIIDEELYGS